MKRLIAYNGIIILFSFPFIGLTQNKYPVTKAYAYRQKVSGGINKKGIDANGKLIKLPSSGINYFLYLEYNPEKQITINNIWIKGVSYNFETEKITLPVVIERSIKLGTKTDADTLVSPSKNEIIGIQPGQINNTVKTTNYIKRLIQNNDVLFVYRCKGKTYYLAVKSFKQLAEEIRK